MRRFTEKTALYVGGISPLKGILVMLDACSRVVRKIPNFTLLVVGRVWDEDEFHSMVDKLGINRNVKHVDWVYPSSLPHYGKIASIGILIDQNRKHLELGGLGQGRKLFTYLWLGLPVIAQNYSNIGQFIKKHNLGFVVNPHDSEQIATSILAMIENPLKSKKIGEKGVRLIRTELNWEQQFYKIAKAYHL